MTKVKIDKNETKYWTWCIQNLNQGQWKMMTGFMGESGTFIFDNPEDATLFKLVHGL